MAQPEFDIAIGKDGKVTVTVRGVSGQQCVALSDMLKEIIGKEDSRALTPEYYGSPGRVRMDAKVQGRTGG
jgi:Protein of unknown function (DUF2997)